MHIGSYDDEPVTVGMMHDFMTAEGYELDITDQRFHHEIYLSDARRTAPEKLKTVIRHPVKRMMHDFMTAEGYELDITDQRFHHEIYLSDARRTAPEKLKTVIRHPVKRIL